MTGFIVYKHTSPSSKVYIGITQLTPSMRFQNGKGYRDNKHFSRAIKKYGWQNFKHEILYSGLSKEIACEIEIELIAKHNSTDGKYGYNIATGGEHAMHSEKTRRKISVAAKGRVFSEETRKKISEANRSHVVSEETRRKIGEANRRRIISEETRRKISTANKGRIFSEEARKKMSDARPKRPVLCIETGVVYESMLDAQRKTGIHAGSISNVCFNKCKTTGGFHWKFYEESEK